MNGSPVVAIRSVDLGVPDLTLAESFYTKAWGLSVVARQNRTLYLRANGRDHHVLALRAHPAPEILSVGFRVCDRDALDKIATTAENTTGCIVTRTVTNKGPDGGVLLKLVSPEGYIFHFHFGDELHHPEITQRSFPVRLSHVNLNCSDIEATSAFFQRVLGFALTDRSKTMAFLSCNADHHAVVLADSGVNGLNHVAYMMPEWDSVMRGSGRMIDNGWSIAWGVGRHGPGDNVFSYFIDPFGFVIEYTAEVLQLDATYHPHGPDYWIWPSGRTDHWGIAPPKQDSLKRSQLAIRFADYRVGASQEQ